jgi:hypothetical protein
MRFIEIGGERCIITLSVALVHVALASRAEVFLPLSRCELKGDAGEVVVGVLRYLLFQCFLQASYGQWPSS